MSTLVSVEEASKILNLSKQHIRTMCREGKIIAEKIGNSWVIEEAVITRYKLQSSPHDHPVHSNRVEKKPLALSFFSGAMGLDLGLEKAGFDIRLTCENDKFCRQTIALNRPNIALIGDINEYSAEEVLSLAGVSKGQDVDLVVGGPPCQAFSTAGARRAFNDERGNVFLTYIDLALAIQPKFIVIENVRGLLSCPMKHRPHNKRGAEYPELLLDELRGGALNFVLDRLQKSGYQYSFNLYNAANFGTPQVRERVILICSRDGRKPPFLVPTHSETKRNGYKKWRTFRQTVKGLQEHDHLKFPEKRLRFYRLLNAGENWRQLPEDLQKEALGKAYYAGGGKTGFLRRLAWDRPAPTLVTHPAMPATDLAHPVEDRPLSIQEYKRLQEFPDNWELAGSLVQQYKQIGNAVPGSLGFAVGKHIQDLINDREIINEPDFKYSRYKNTNDIDWAIEFNKAVQKNLPTK